MRRKSFAGRQKKRKLVSRSKEAAEIFVGVIGEPSEPIAEPRLDVAGADRLSSPKDSYR
jgi:hypothetical protein